MNTTIKIGTIREIHRELISNGIRISEHALRSWVKEKKVPAAYSGVIAYVSYDAVVDFLMNTPTRTA